MQSVIKDSEWYKDVTKGFIDTTPPKPAVKPTITDDNEKDGKNNNPGKS